MTKLAWGIVFAALGAVFFAGGAQLQHAAVNKRTAPKSAASCNTRVDSSFLRTGFWYLGLFLVLVGCLVHLLAVALAPISLVQPIGALSVPITAALNWYFNAVRPRVVELFSLAACLFAIAIFTVFASSWVNNAAELVAGVVSFWWYAFGIMAFAFFLFALMIFFSPSIEAISPDLLLDSSRPDSPQLRDPWPRQSSLGFYWPLGWGIGAGILYGLATSSIKLVFLQAPFVPLLSWLFEDSSPLFPSGFSANCAVAACGVTNMVFVLTLLFIALCYVIGIWALQQGFAKAPAHLMVACLTIFDPVIALILGLGVFGEAQGLSVFKLLILAVIVALLLVTLFLLARTAHHERKTENR